MPAHKKDSMLWQDIRNTLGFFLWDHTYFPVCGPTFLFGIAVICWVTTRRMHMAQNDGGMSFKKLKHE